VMSKVRAFGAFWYDFVIGDDWRVALGVAVAFVLTYAMSRATSLALWWIVPVAVVILLPVSVRRLTRRPH
jgi:hypothetical protein